MLQNLKIFWLEYRIAILIFLISRVLVFGTFFLAGSYDVSHDPSMNQWDAPHYISIAEHGYQWNGEYKDDSAFIAFYPFFPATIRLVHFETSLDFLNSALLVSFLAGLGSILLLYRLVSDWKGKETALAAVFLLSFFPSGVFLSSAYTESLFLLLVLSCFYFLQKKYFWCATFCVAFACVTRVTGGVLGIVFAGCLWRETKSIPKTILLGSVALIPFLGFLYFQYVKYGTPFAFLLAQKAYWYHQATFPWTGLRIFFQYVWHSNSVSAMWRTDAFFLVLMAVTLALSWKKIPWHIWWFGLGVVCLTLSETFIVGTSRYMMLCLPFYFYWGDVLSKRPNARGLAIAISSGWMVFNTILFIFSKSIY